MATVIRHQGQEMRQNATSKVSFLRSQLILFNSRRKHGLLYSIATAGALFCVPGVLGVIASETEMNLLIQRTIPLPLITLMITVGMFVLNDLVDKDLDKANSKKRPIASELVSRRQAWTFIILTNGAAVGMLLILFDLLSVVVVLPMILIGILYSMTKIALMKRFLFKNVSIAIFYMLCAILGMTSIYGRDLVINNPIVLVHTIAISGVMIFVGSIVNDLGDTEGDKAAGRHTIPVVLGGGNTIKMLIILLAIMPAISWMLYETSAELNYHAISIMAPIGVTIVASLALLRMATIHRVFEDRDLMRKQHKKWFPLYMALQSCHVIAGFSPL